MAESSILLFDFWYDIKKARSHHCKRAFLYEMSQKETDAKYSTREQVGFRFDWPPVKTAAARQTGSRHA